MAINKTKPRQNALDLRKPLLNSQVQKSDQALFQTVNQLLEQVQELQERLNKLEGIPSISDLLNSDIHLH